MSQVRSRVSRPRRAVLLLVDGARPDVFRHLVSAGDLPHLSRHVLEPGGMVPATTVFPSTTGVAYLPFLTGRYPGPCNVPGIRWLDVARYGGRWWRDREHVRSYCGYQGGRLDGDVEGSGSSLFELIPDAVAICTPLTGGLRRRGVRASRARVFWGALAHYTSRFAPLERAVGKWLRQTATERPEFVFAVFPGVDGATHFHDPWHPAVGRLYREVDAALGAYAAAGGLDDDPLVIVVSDHGASAVHRHTDVALELEAMGLPTLRHPVLWRRHPRAAVMVSGNGAAHVYLRPGRRRTRRFTIPEIEAGDVPDIPRDLVERLAGRPGIALVAGVDDDGVLVVSRDGRARIGSGLEGPAYQALTADVLELGGSATLPDRTWHWRTVRARFPDAPAQLRQVFQAPRTGDLIVIAAEGTDLRQQWEIPEHRSGHGSLIRDHMRCLLAANVPLAGPMPTVDVFPLILEFLGRAVPEGIDGAVAREPRPPVRRPA